MPALAVRRSSSSRGRVSDLIAARITKDITEGVLVPGQKLPAERELAERFKTSRLSVREAYRALEEMGLITIKRGAGGGAFIAELDHQPVARSLALMLRLGRTSLHELTEARVLLEPPIARLAARRASPDDIARLEELLRRQEAALRSREGPRPLALGFHRLVARSARNLPLQIVMDSLADLTVGAITNLYLSTDVHRHVVHFHRRIINAIKRHDEEAAYELMRRHVLEVQQRMAEPPRRKRAARRGLTRRGRPARRKSR